MLVTEFSSYAKNSTLGIPHFTKVSALPQYSGDGKVVGPEITCFSSKLCPDLTVAGSGPCVSS